jgi:hypothetical protein
MIVSGTFIQPVIMLPFLLRKKDSTKTFTTKTPS